MSMSARGAIPLRRAVKQEQPSILHAHTLKGLALARLAGPRASIIISVHRGDLGNYNRSLRLASRIIAVSAGMIPYLRPYIGRRQVDVVPNGILDSPRTRHFHDVPLTSLARPALVYVGGLYMHKGLQVLLQALAHIRAVGSVDLPHLYMVGEGPDRPALERMATELQLNEVAHFLGFRKDAYSYIRSADVFVLPSLRETFGLVLAEARQAGVPIVASQEGGIPEVLDGGRAGRLVPPGDVLALSTALTDLLSSAEERQRMSREASDGIDWLSCHRMAADVSTVYQQALDAK